LGEDGVGWRLIGGGGTRGGAADWRARFSPRVLYVAKESNAFCDADEKLFVRLHLGPVITCPHMS
jgi:hypothetical protein